ncbi:hypothetical protein MUN74_07710 [Agromyces endophyticus]|uniref:hypothetical protein n=1 Tax=Agromyces sp. H17E-10 TaxID=2932244 RepID=UPI001FD5D61D|nr:hypothetical protein [Agromyces sp. H17E-10]UOQ90776.1 hypothetical protein MUN74_07710 [Agromyces sp. H17E-10]
MAETPSGDGSETAHSAHTEPASQASSAPSASRREQRAAARSTVRRGRLRATIDRVPTSWLATGFVVVLLGASAAFGGLADAPEPPIAKVVPGESIAGTQLEIAVTGATVADALPELYLEAEPGMRYVTVTADVENVWTTPASSGDFGTVVRLGGVVGKALTVFDVDDARANPVLQHGVPRALGWVWKLPADAVDDSVGVRVYDRSYTEGKTVTSGGSFGDPVLVAAGPVAVVEAPAPSPDATIDGFAAGDSE